MSLSTLATIWNKVKTAGISAYNAIFRANFAFSANDKPTEHNILTPEGFPLQIEVSAVDADKITATLPILNAATSIGTVEVNLSVNALVCYTDPVNPADDPFKIISLSKEVENHNFAQTYDAQLDYNVTQAAIAAKYQHNILYLCVASKSADGKVVQNSGTFTKVN